MINSVKVRASHIYRPISTAFLGVRETRTPKKGV